MAFSDLFRKKETLLQKTEAVLRLHRCAFTGHRPERIRGMEVEIIAGLRKEILAAIEDGYTTFITGCSRGVDLWAALTACVIPFIPGDIIKILIASWLVQRLRPLLR